MMRSSAWFCVVGVQCGQTEVTSFGEGDSVLHGFTGTHLTNHYHIRRLTQSVFQGDFKTVRIQPHFPLGDDAALVLVDKFDGVFDRDNMAGTVVVTMANH